MQLPMPKNRQQGLSLVELMVAVTIGLLLLAGLLSVVTGTSRSYGELNKTSRQLENGRYALQILKTEIQHAGFYGGMTDLTTLPTPSTAPDLPDPGLVTAADLQDALSLPIQGYDDPTSPSGSITGFSDANHVSGTDILVIRRTATEPVAIEPTATAPSSSDDGNPALEQNRFYLQGTGAGYVLQAEDADPDNDWTLWNTAWRRWDGTTSYQHFAPIFPYEVHIYFVSPCSEPSSGTVCDSTADGGVPIPTLKRLVLGKDGSGNAAMVLEPLVEGIQDMQIDYGVDSDDDGAPNGSYTAAPGSITDWTNVVSVRINLLARNIEPSGGPADTKTYTLGEDGDVGPFNDHYKRHVYSMAVRANNLSGRREQ